MRTRFGEPVDAGAQKEYRGEASDDAEEALSPEPVLKCRSVECEHMARVIATCASRRIRKGKKTCAAHALA